MPTAIGMPPKRMFLGSSNPAHDRKRIEKALRTTPSGMTFNQLRSRVQTISEKDLRLHVLGLLSRGSATITQTSRIKYSK
jgi:hypothetical protein